MIKLHTWHTPNGKKPAILLAELGLSYELVLVDLGKKEQKAPAFLALNPNGKIPALEDGDITIFESGAILVHLADKAGKFLPQTPKERAAVLAWTFWQVGGPGPMFGQVGRLGGETPRDEKAYGYFLAEAKRLASVFEKNLEAKEYAAGDYSIADMMLYPWVSGAAERMPAVLEGLSGVRGWLDRVGARPAVQRGMRLEP